MAENTFFQELAEKKWQAATVVLLVLLVASIATQGFAFLHAENRPSGPSVVADGDAHAIGSEDAPVLIQEWSDFECPFCGRFYSDAYQQIKTQYIDTGKVRLEFHHFPLSFHQLAMPAAVAAECAGEQGKFWEYHDKIFEQQSGMNAFSFGIWADELGLNRADFDSCVESGKHEPRILADMQAGQAGGVQGTPGFLVNGKLVSGAQPFAVFQQIIEAEL